MLFSLSLPTPQPIDSGCSIGRLTDTVHGPASRASPQGELEGEGGETRRRGGEEGEGCEQPELPPGTR